jgi:CheY-like chemotaxis protein
VREQLEEIVLTARRATEVCRQMLAYSGKGTMRLEEVDLSEVVAEMARMLEVSISKKTRLVYELGHGLPRALGDPTQMRQVALNLITNASEALGDDPGTVHLRTGAGHVTREELKAGLSAPEPVAGTYVWLEVEDTGCGMDESTLELVFDPFFSTKFVGRGLGLSTVLGILRGHEGAIRIWSRPGKGTRFRVLFPAALDGVSTPPPEETPFEEPEGAASPFVSASASAPGSGERRAGLVLLVDDEPAVLKVGASMLRRLGYEVVTASDGRSGLETFERRHGELAFCVLDLSMPEMGGDEVFRAMRALVPTVRVILTSGYDESEAAKRMGRGQRYRFLQKPFGSDELGQAVRELLGARRNPG